MNAYTQNNPPPKDVKKYTVQEVLDSLSWANTDHDGDYDGYLHIDSDIDGRGIKISIKEITETVVRGD